MYNVVYFHHTPYLSSCNAWTPMANQAHKQYSNVTSLDAEKDSHIRDKWVRFLGFHSGG
jgi:hypothetical protein